MIHLLAELIENATAFSPPGTRVQVAGQPAPHGYVIEVEDRGLGMSDEELILANERLANPPRSTSPSAGAGAATWSAASASATASRSSSATPGTAG